MSWRRGRAYSQDLRGRVLLAADDGQRVGQIASALRVSISYVSKVLSRRQRTGLTTALPQHGRVVPKLAGLEEAIRDRVKACPDATLMELRAWLAATHRVTASTALLCRTLARLQLTYKKVASRGRAGPPGRRRGATYLAPSAARPQQAAADLYR